MGNTVTRIVDNLADISIKSNNSQVLAKTSGARALLHRVYDDNESEPSTFLTFTGEISSHLSGLTRNISLEEPNSITVKYSFQLNDNMEGFNLNDYDYANRVVQGIGNISFISTATGTVSNIPLCLESLTIDPAINNLARAVYKGHISRDISLAQGYNMNSCVTCLIKMDYLPSMP